MTIEKKILNVPFELKEGDVEETGLFRGYGAIFGIKDSHSDVIMPGAFTKTLAAGGRNRSGVAMLYQHDFRRPIGVWNLLAEDRKGLKVEGQLAIKTKDGGDTYELMKLGALKGLSIGYDAIIHEFDSKKKIRYLKEVELWEISPVTFGANIKASVTAVKELKELIQRAGTERELERALRESDIFSKTDAQHVISLIKTVLRDSGTADEAGLSIVLDGLKTINDDYNEKGIGGNRNLPLDAGVAWDATAAIGRIRNWAGGPDKDDVDFRKYRQAFVWFNPVDPNIFGSYKLPFADVIGGTLKAKWGGVFRAMGAVLGARGGVAIPAADRKRAYNFLASYYRRFDKPIPDFKDYSEREWKEAFPDYVIGMMGILETLQKINKEG